MSPSSSAERGITYEDIIKSDLVGRETGKTLSYNSRMTTFSENAFQALADAKVWTGKIAMHLDREARDRYFKQLDQLHDCEEWVDGDLPLQLDSYKGFIRFMFLARGAAKPSLALSSKGRLLAVWRADTDRLTVEFLSGDSVDWVVSHKVGDQIERAAGSTTITRLLANLAPYRVKEWFGIE
jgi:hypothetical protein